MELLEKLVSSNVNFSIWKLPHEDIIYQIQEGVSNSQTDHISFIIRPFISPADLPGYTITSKKAENQTIAALSFPEETSKKAYLALAEKTIASIHAGHQDKVVISRVKKIERTANQTLDGIFAKLCQQYPKAFVFCYHHRQLGTWLGATPEQLISVRDKQFSTMALAGTKPNNDHSPWEEKEKKEHQFVIDDILCRIKAIPTKKIEQHPTETISTGTVNHLRTTITFSSELKADIIAEQLHPTPAICGTPTSAALDFILTHENYNRSCYTGYLGPQQEDRTNFFVNLRSMQVTKDNFYLYLGGGITKDSIPEKEWEETKNKAQTMLSVIQKC